MTAITESLKIWTERVLNSKRKEMSPGELSSLFQQQELSRAFFRIIDRDQNGSISLEEWTGCFSKLLRENEEHLMSWFVGKFNMYCSINDTVYLTEEDFANIANEIEFGYRFASIVSPNSRRVKTLQLITSLEILASMSTDSKWLSWLKFQFTDAMKKSNRYNKNELYVTLQDFVENFNFKEPFLAERLFSYLDTDKSGTLTLHEFINGLEVVVNGSQENKMQFLFKVFDVDGDGHLDYDELRMLLKCCLEDSPSLDVQETVDDLAAILFKDIDRDESGDIIIDELKVAFKKHESLFKTLSVSTSIWIKPKYITVQHKRSWYHKLKETIGNKRALCIFWTSYVLINLACMITALCSYIDAPVWVIIARMFGNSLNFNCSLILVLVLRKHLTWLREKGACFFVPIDDSIEIHKKVGVVILIETLIHTLAHLKYLLDYCIEKNENYWTLLFTASKSLGYPTGIIDFFLLLIILLFAMPFVRNKGFFQLFYWFHMLTIPWFLIMLLHGKAFWRWLLLPFFCYIVEKILRFRKVSSNKYGDTVITEACILPSKVTHLVIRKPPKFHFKPGDYVFINIPIVAKYEWHPFSISSAPENSDFIWLHIKTCGNWTKRLYNFSSSSHFDANTSVANLSNIRCNMRTRMSVNLFSNDSKFSGLTTAAIEASKNSEKSSSVGRKAVSFGSIPEMPNIPETNEIEHEIESQETAIIPPLRHKGILKGMTMQSNVLDKSTSSQVSCMAGNMGGSGNDLKHDSPSVSTPKHNDEGPLKIVINVDPVQQEQQQQKQVESHRLLAKKELLFDQKQKSAENLCGDEKLHPVHKKPYRSKTTDDVDSENKASCLVKLAEHFKSLELELYKGNEEKFEKESNITGQYLRTKNKKENNENAANHMVINLEQNVDNTRNVAYSSNDQPKMIERKNSFGDKLAALSVRRGSEALSTISDKDQDNILGYMKMYRKHSKVSAMTIGTDEMWRLKVFIDGPYGSPSQSIFDSEHAVLVSAGIGITPFASILQSLMHRYRRAKATCPNCEYRIGDELLCLGDDKLAVKKVDFIWITREQRSLEWFISMLSQMEIEQAKTRDTFMETHLYVTSAKRQSDLRSIGLHLTLDAICSKEESKMIDGLKQRTHFGRPNWDIVLQSLIRKQKGKINMFYCGPPNLCTVLQTKCYEYNISFKKEIF